MVALAQKAALQDLASLIAYAGEEAVVGRRLDEHFLARKCQGLDGGRCGRHHARRVKDPVALDRPSVATFEPLDDRLVVAVWYKRITEDRVCGPILDGLLNGRSDGKVHVCHPHRYHVVRRHCVPFDAACAAPFHGLVEEGLVYHRLDSKVNELPSSEVLATCPLAN